MVIKYTFLLFGGSIAGRYIFHSVIRLRLRYIFIVELGGEGRKKRLKSRLSFRVMSVMPPKWSSAPGKAKRGRCVLFVQLGCDPALLDDVLYVGDLCSWQMTVWICCLRAVGDERRSSTYVR